MIRKFYEAEGGDGGTGGAPLVETTSDKATPTDVQSELKRLKGAFVGSLQRNNKQIRDDRALAIAQKAKRAFKRTVEDISDGIREMQIARENMLDLSADNKNSLVLAANFDPEQFVKDDLKLGVDIRNAEIKLDIAARRYEYLFGENLLKD